MTLLAGAARVDITPPPGQPMAGFPMLNRDLPDVPADISGYFGRQGLAAGTHDPLYARALVLDDGRRALAVVAVDLLVVTADLTAAVRRQVRDLTGIEPDLVMVAASHTHAGPDLFGWNQEAASAEVKEMVLQGVVKAVHQAYGLRRPARVGWADVKLGRISVNRRDPAGPIDPRVGVMRVEDEEEKPIALVVNFAVHNCLLSADNLLYSADLSGYAVAALERVYPTAVALFLNGAAGNINPVAYPWGRKVDVVPVFRKAWQGGRPHPRTFRNATRLGHILAAAAIRGAEQVRVVYSAVDLAGATRRVSLPLRPPEELARFRAFMNFGPDFGGSRLAGQSFDTEVQVLAVGRVLYIGLPGEPFVELGLEIRRQLAPTRTYVVGYANDDVRYVLPLAAYAENRYDTWASLLSPGGGERLVESACRLAQEVLRHGR